MIVLDRVNEINPREASSLILGNYISQRNNLKNIINNYFKKSKYDSRDRRFISEIVRGTVRYLLKIDYLISLFSNIEIDSIDSEIINVLRTAVYQLMFMSRVPGYSTVDESVKIIKKHIGKPATGFANAVLRKISSIENLSEYTDKKINGEAGSFNHMLSLKHSFPLWVVDYWAGSYGREKIERLLVSLNRPSLNFIRINSLKTTKNDYIRLFMENGLIPGKDFEDFGGNRDLERTFADIIALKSLQDIDNIPGYLKGFFSVQDFSSQFAVKNILVPHPNEKILDLCGAPGGKATYMAELSGDGCEVVSIDKNKNRLKIFKKNVKRLGIKNIRVIESDIMEENFTNYRNYFDKIFIDSPCSALGTISKNPDVKYNKSMDDIKRLSRQSLQILSKCGTYLKPGGRIVFYTCTVSRIENQDVINRFLEDNKNIFEPGVIGLPEHVSTYLDNRNIHLSNDNGILEIMPYYFNSEGGFAAEIYKNKK